MGGRPKINFDELLARSEIAALLTGLVCKKSGSVLYYIQPNGSLLPAKVSAKLVELTSSKTATRALAEAKRRGIIQTYVDPPKPEKAVPAKATVKSRVKPRKVKPEPDDEPEELDDEPQKSRYSLIYRDSGYHGIFDSSLGTVTLISRDKKPALQELARLQKGEHKVSHPRFYCGIA